MVKQLCIFWMSVTKTMFFSCIIIKRCLPRHELVKLVLCVVLGVLLLVLLGFLLLGLLQGRRTRLAGGEGSFSRRPTNPPVSFQRYQLLHVVLRCTWIFLEFLQNTLTSGNDHSSLSGMCARHQTGVWRVPSCPLLEENLSKPCMKNICRAMPVLNTDLLNMYYKKKTSGNDLGSPSISAKFAGEALPEKPPRPAGHPVRAGLGERAEA